ncbi:hypothetical protein [Niastella populi]|uniref:Uncharacterized protein n=1 Tax=Niastella populi TaxID=550983 RepID=A0A1V9FDE5_9BACT|nr:hypothetical protein [Niastella populi]OQP56400.1 hypothetical protein A4R26_04345 [Niastella populi]
MLIEYYLRNYGKETDSSEQAKLLRNIILSGKPEPEVIAEFSHFVLSQDQLYPDTALLINGAIMAHYGSAYMGLGSDDFQLKSDLYKQFTDKFPASYELMFHYADCKLMAEGHAGEIWPILKTAMLLDKDNVRYPTSELFDLIHDSEFSFEFDMLLLEKYYPSSGKDAFDENVKEFKEKYTTKAQQDYLDRVKWKG